MIERSERSQVTRAVELACEVGIYLGFISRSIRLDYFNVESFVVPCAHVVGIVYASLNFEVMRYLTRLC